MSGNIIATSFTDPNINTIRTQVGLNDDKIPYLLLPVKIETRFMKVDRPVVKSNVFPEVLEALSNLENYARFNPANVPVHELSGRYKKLAEGVKAVEEKAATIKNLDGNLKETLINKINALVKVNKGLGDSAGKISSLDSKEIIQLRSFRNSTEDSLKTILAIASKLQPQPPAGDTFLQPLEDIVQALTSMSVKNISAPSRIEKRQSFSFLNEMQALISVGIKEMQKNIASNITTSPAQLKQLDKLSAQLQPLSKKAILNIKKLPSKYKSAEYKARQDDITQKLTLLQQQVEKGLKPKLQVMQEIQRINATTLLVEVNDLQSLLKKYNAASFKKFDELIAKCKVLYKKMDTLIADTRKVIVGDENEFNSIKKTWDDTDSELEKLVKRISAFTPGTNEEKAELDNAVNQINTVLRNQLTNIKSDSGAPVMKMDNSSLDKALSVYSSSLDKLNDLNKKMQSGKGSSANLIKKADELYHFSEKSPGLPFLPKQAYGELLKASKTLEENLNRLKKPATAGKKARSKASGGPDAAGNVRELLETSRKEGIFRTGISPVVEDIPSWYWQRQPLPLMNCGYAFTRMILPFIHTKKPSPRQRRTAEKHIGWKFGRLVMTLI